MTGCMIHPFVLYILISNFKNLIIFIFIGKVDRLTKLTANANVNKMKDKTKESNTKHSKIAKPKAISNKTPELLNKENEEISFISGEYFDFSKPMDTPYENSPLRGPMTR